MLAQALLEKGILDTLASQASVLMSDLSYEVQQRPWLWIIVGVVTFLLLVRHGRR
jgi:hypothetical protein